MRSLAWRLVLVGGAVLVTALAALGIAESQWVVPGVVATVLVVALAAFAGERVLLGLLVTAALFQPPIVSIGPFPQLQAGELLVPLMLGFILLRWGLGLGGEAALPPPSRRGRQIQLAVGAYGLVLAVNLVRSKLLISSVKGVNRAYYDYFVALGVYLILYLAVRRGQLPLAQVRRILLVLSTVVSIIGIAVVLLHLPLNIGNLRYSVYDYGNGAVRVGFLEVSGLVGLALVVSQKSRYWPLTGGLFMGALFASGGRTSLIGAIVAAGVYLVITQRSVYILVATVLVALVVYFVPAVGQSVQVQRLTNVNGQEFNADGRTLIYSRSFSGFLADPLFGTGIGVPEYVQTPQPDVAAFYEAQLEVGGHAAYVSILKNLGLMGFLPFVAAPLLALGGLRKRVRRDPDAAFFFIFLAAETVSLVASGNGSETSFFLPLAGAAALIAGIPESRAALVDRPDESRRSEPDGRWAPRGLPAQL